MDDESDDIPTQLSNLHKVTLSKFAPNLVIAGCFPIENLVMADLFRMELVEIEVPSLRIVLTDRGRHVLLECGWEFPP